MSIPVPFRLLSKRDEENLEFLLSRHLHMGKSEAIRWLLEDYRIRHEDGQSKDKKLDALLAQVECLHAKIEMILCECGMKPISNQKESI